MKRYEIGGEGEREGAMFANACMYVGRKWLHQHCVISVKHQHLHPLQHHSNHHHSFSHLWRAPPRPLRTSPTLLYASPPCCPERMYYDRMCYENVRVKRMCITRMCVNRMYVKRMRVIRMCVMRIWVTTLLPMRASTATCTVGNRPLLIWAWPINGWRQGK